MKKRSLCIALMLLTLLLSGCGDSAPQASAPKETAAPTAEPKHAPEVTAQGQLADAARKLMAPFQQEIAVAAAQSPLLLTYLIPGDLLSQMAQDAQETGAQPEGGRYRFTWRQSGNHTYVASAMQIQQIEAAAEHTPDPQATGDPVMDNQQMGDFSASGGGLFERTRSYDVDENLQEGQAEITDTLNGQMTGHELFSFSVLEGQLFFVDALLDQAVDVDGLVTTSQYLVAAGVLRTNGMEIVEFTVPALADVPAAAPQSWEQLQSRAGSFLSRLVVNGQSVQTAP